MNKGFRLSYFKTKPFWNFAMSGEILKDLLKTTELRKIPEGWLEIFSLLISRLISRLSALSSQVDSFLLSWVNVGFFSFNFFFPFLSSPFLFFPLFLFWFFAAADFFLETNSFIRFGLYRKDIGRSTAATTYYQKAIIVFHLEPSGAAVSQ